MDDSGLSPVIVKAWLPKDALPVPAEGEEAPARKALETLLELIPERLKRSAPYAQIKALEATIEENKAKLEAGEVTEEEYDKQPEEDLAAATAAYDELTTALCKGPYTTIQWVDSLVAYNTAGVTTVIPGGALTADDCFGVNGNPLATTSKVLAEFVKHVKLEKAESSVVPSYMPNLFGEKSPAEEAAGWVDMQCALLGAESLDHVLLCWWDDAVSGVGECVKALKATEKVGKVSLVGPKTSKATLIAAHVAGEKPSSVVLSALTALTPACAPVRSECKLLRVPVIASDVLLGGLVSDAYVGKPVPDKATLAGTAAFDALGAILEKEGGWEKFQGLLQALKATGRGLETAMVQAHLDAGMHVIVETELKGPPPFTLGGAALSEDQTAAIVAALSA